MNLSTLTIPKLSLQQFFEEEIVTDLTAVKYNMELSMRLQTVVKDLSKILPIETLDRIQEATKYLMELYDSEGFNNTLQLISTTL